MRDKVPSSNAACAPLSSTVRPHGTVSTRITCSRWQRAAQELEITIQAPYTLVARDGARFEFACLLPQFGGKNGMVLGTNYDEAAANAATAAGAWLLLSDR